MAIFHPFWPYLRCSLSKARMPMTTRSILIMYTKTVTIRQLSVVTLPDIKTIWPVMPISMHTHNMNSALGWQQRPLSLTTIPTPALTVTSMLIKSINTTKKTILTMELLRQGVGEARQTEAFPHAICSYNWTIPNSLENIILQQFWVTKLLIMTGARNLIAQNLLLIICHYCNLTSSTVLVTNGAMRHVQDGSDVSITTLLISI